ncbi:MAG: GDSL-type esterase/lipase family protein [Clostridiales Family XIII bacterium]|jgi:lysophospholipase L1-like esterase|nr:GDSL-type esterase/lipase family protein [Clostridiales Family XIII bacterium]
MYPGLDYEYNKKERSKLSRFIPFFAFVLIVIGLSLTLCADMVDEPAKRSLIAKISAPAAEEIGEPSVPDEMSDADATDTPPAVATDLSSATARTDGAEQEYDDESAEEDALGAQPPGPGDISATVAASASSAEKVSEEDNSYVELPASVDVTETDDYFSDALFIGDSRTQGLLLYSNLGNASYYAARGLTVEQVFKKAVVDSGGGKLTVSDALSRRAFGKVYLMFGLNELGWNSADKFIEQYGLVLDRVRETQPDAIIYVQGIMPVSAWKSAKDPVHNNPNIARFNEMIQGLTSEKNAIYLNVSDGVADESGVLPDEASSDGIHLNKKYCIKWEEYLRAHEM